MAGMRDPMTDAMVTRAEAALARKFPALDGDGEPIEGESTAKVEDYTPRELRGIVRQDYQEQGGDPSESELWAEGWISTTEGLEDDGDGGKRFTVRLGRKVDRAEVVRTPVRLG